MPNKKLFLLFLETIFNMLVIEGVDHFQNSHTNFDKSFYVSSYMISFLSFFLFRTNVKVSLG